MPEGPGLSERERRYVIQQAQNAYYGRDLETLERLLRQLLAMVPRNETSNESRSDGQQDE